MMLNRQNYEEYFLLYVDNELTLHQRMEVEIFVAQHPDLAEELARLQEAVLPPDTTRLEDKSFLHIREEAPVNITNYEELLLLYVDNELDAVQREQVEQYAGRYPHIRRQLQLLQQTVLPPETIVFPDKNSLYRNSSRVIPLLWKRLSVAAVLLGILVLAWWLFPSGNTRQRGNVQVAQTSDKTPQKAGPGQEQHNSAAGQQPAEEARTAGNNTGRSLQQQDGENKDNRITAGTASQPKRSTAAQAAYASQGRTSQTNSPTNPYSTKEEPATVPVNRYIHTEEPVIAATSRPTPATLPALATTPIPVEDKALPVTATGAMQEEQQNTYAVHHTAYRELNTSEDDQGVYIGSLELNKNKIKGFFKKATRIFAAKARASADEDGRLELANMKINTRQ
jgi:hypothetical protein